LRLLDHEELAMHLASAQHLSTLQAYIIKSQGNWEVSITCTLKSQRQTYDNKFKNKRPRSISLLPP
jgi:hypothetical protein